MKSTFTTIYTDWTCLPGNEMRDVLYPQYQYFQTATLVPLYWLTRESFRSSFQKPTEYPFREIMFLVLWFPTAAGVRWSAYLLCDGFWFTVPNATFYILYQVSFIADQIWHLLIWFRQVRYKGTLLANSNQLWKYSYVIYELHFANL